MQKYRVRPVYLYNQKEIAKRKTEKGTDLFFSELITTSLDAPPVDLVRSRVCADQTVAIVRDTTTEAWGLACIAV